MSNKADSSPPKWLGLHDVVDASHIPMLETQAALNEFSGKMPRHEAEASAHASYKKDQLTEAAAHHLVGMKAAHAAGDMDSAKKHSVMYMLALKSLGHEGMDPPPEVDTKAKNLPNTLARFRPHKADQYSIPKLTE